MFHISPCESGQNPLTVNPETVAHACALSSSTCNHFYVYCVQTSNWLLVLLYKIHMLLIFQCYMLATVIGKQFIKFGVIIFKLNHYYKHEENEKRVGPPE